MAEQTPQQEASDLRHAAAELIGPLTVELCGEEDLFWAVRDGSNQPIMSLGYRYGDILKSIITAANQTLQG